MVRVRLRPLTLGDLGKLERIATDVRGIRIKVPRFGEDSDALGEVLDALDRISWRIAGKSLLQGAGGPIYGHGAPFSLVRVEVDGVIHYGGYRRLGGDVLFVDSAYGSTAQRIRGRTEAEAAERFLRQLVTEHQHAVAQGWKRLG